MHTVATKAFRRERRHYIETVLGGLIIYNLVADCPAAYCCQLIRYNYVSNVWQSTTLWHFQAECAQVWYRLLFTWRDFS